MREHRQEVTLDPHALLRALFDAAVASADPARLLPGRPPPSPSGRVVVVGAGKAGASMAAALERGWNRPLEGLVVVPYGHAVPCRGIEVVEAAHPVPDAAGQEAAERIFKLASELAEDDLLVCLISGGGSALLALPADGVTLEEKRAVNAALLKSGASIAEMNCVRKHLSAVKGGRLAAAAHPAKVLTFLISDVPGDDPAVIASGPTIADPTTFTDALGVLRKYDIAPPAPIEAFLEAGAAGGGGTPGETPKPGDIGFAGDEVVVLATAADALHAAARRAEAAGVAPIELGDDLEGEARDLGAAHAALAAACSKGPEAARSPLAAALAAGVVRETAPIPAPPLVLLSGGETTVTVRGAGRGGRNTEYLLALCLALDNHAGIHALAADTDGIDGVETSAGAYASPDTLARSVLAGVDPHTSLTANDSWAVFSATGDLIMTGPTLTNVNDFRAILIL